MATDLIRFSVTVPEPLLRDFDNYIGTRGLSPNRSETIRDLIRETLSKENIYAPDQEITGTLTMVYNHHVPDLTRNLDEVQHMYGDAIISSMHVHLNHDYCLEVVALKGPSKNIYEIADKLLGIKGVVHGDITAAPIPTSENSSSHHDHDTHEDCSHTHSHPHSHDNDSYATNFGEAELADEVAKALPYRNK